MNTMRSIIFLITLFSFAFASTDPHALIPTAFRYPNFMNRPKLTFVGDARGEFDKVVIAGPSRKQTGAVWFTETFDVSAGFFTEFQLTISKVDNL